MTSVYALTFYDSKTVGQVNKCSEIFFLKRIKFREFQGGQIESLKGDSDQIRKNDYLAVGLIQLYAFFSWISGQNINKTVSLIL